MWGNNLPCIHTVYAKEVNLFHGAGTCLSCWTADSISTGIKVFNHLPSSIRNLSHKGEFRLTLRRSYELILYI